MTEKPAEEPHPEPLTASERRRRDAAHDIEILRRSGPDHEADAIAAWHASRSFPPID
jgi:hypothetical protein